MRMQDCTALTWWEMTSIEASAAVAMVSNSSSFQFNEDELDRFFPETTFDLGEIASEFEFGGAQQRQLGR